MQKSMKLKIYDTNSGTFVFIYKERIKCQISRKKCIKNHIKGFRLLIISSQKVLSNLLFQEHTETVLFQAKEYCEDNFYASDKYSGHMGYSML